MLFENREPKGLLCRIRNKATNALDEVVAIAVSAAVIEQFNKLLNFIRCKLHVDVSMLFKVIATMALLFWIIEWVDAAKELFFCKIPKFIKNLCKGKKSALKTI